MVLSDQLSVVCNTMHSMKAMSFTNCLFVFYYNSCIPSVYQCDMQGCFDNASSGSVQRGEKTMIQKQDHACSWTKLDCNGFLFIYAYFFEWRANHLTFLLLLLKNYSYLFKILQLQNREVSSALRWCLTHFISWFESQLLSNYFDSYSGNQYICNSLFIRCAKSTIMKMVTDKTNQNDFITSMEILITILSILSWLYFFWWSITAWLWNSDF